MMSIEEKINAINSQVECENLFSDGPQMYCKHMTNKIGRLSPTSKIFCNTICKKCGPYNAKPINREDEKEFTIKYLKSCPDFIFSKKLLEKIMINYQLPMNIIIPNEYREIKTSLDFLNEYGGFRGVMLTGSLITSTAKKPPKDYDIVIWFSSIEDFIKHDIKKILPKEIQGVKTDYFYYFGEESNLKTLFFTTLDVDNKYLYVSEWYRMKILSIPDGFTLVETSYEAYDETISQMFTKEEIDRIYNKSKWKNVSNTWEMAESFISSAMSRGILATSKDILNIDNSSGVRVSEEIYNIRKTSCFGDDHTPPCENLKKSDDSYYCGGCGCGKNKLSEISRDGYSKLHYPYLKCPLGKPGFS